MGRMVRKWMRHFQLMTTVMAATGLVLNVFCNPFSPIQFLRWVETLRPAQSDAIRSLHRDMTDSTNPSSGAPGSLSSANNPDPD